MKASSGSGLWPTRICWVANKAFSVTEDLVRRPALRHLPGLDPEDRVGRLAGEGVVVRHDDHRRVAVAGQIPHHRQHLGRHLGVEGAGRLVEQDRRRVNRERPGDRNTLLLPAGQLPRPGVQRVGKAHPLQQRLGLRLGRRPRPAEREQRAAHDVLQGGHVREQVELLEHHADAAGAASRATPSADCVPPGKQRASPTRDLAALEHLQPVDAAQQGALAAAGRADERGQPALLALPATRRPGCGGRRGP